MADIGDGHSPVYWLDRAVSPCYFSKVQDRCLTVLKEERMRSFTLTFAKIIRVAALAALCSAATVGLLILMSMPSNASGESCTIELKDGLKEPGTVSSSGQCCSVLHTGKCATKAVDGTYPEALKKFGASKDTKSKRDAANPKTGVTKLTGDATGLKNKASGTIQPVGGTTTTLHNSNSDSLTRAKK